MFLVKILDFSNIPILTLWIVIFFILNTKGFIRKKSMFSLISLAISLIFVMIHVVILKNMGIILSTFNIVVDFLSMIISISMYIYIDDIETRRKVISEVFENRYKNRR